MKDYESLILNALLDKFERSSLAFLSGEELATSSSSRISLSAIKDKLFSDYRAQDCYLYRPDIERSVRNLCEKGFCSAKWDESKDLLEKVCLCPGKVDEAFVFAGRTRKRDRDSMELEMLEKKRRSIHGDTAGRLLVELEDLARKHKSHADWYSGESDLDLFLKMMDAVELQKEEILLRNFSKRNFGDSKVFERNQTRILNAFNAFGDDPESYDGFDSLCKTHNIVRNEGFVIIKGKIVLGIAGMEFDLTNYPYVFAVPNKAFEGLNDLAVLSVAATRLISIENLTTFNYFNDPDAVVVYLGGYAGRHEIELLKKVHDVAGGIECLHMGDIDWGGFRILMDLRKKTGIPFNAFHMGIKELEEYREECIPLSDRDREALAKLLDDPDAGEFRNVISFMLGNGYKLEQESLLFN